jgi:hypothetical protein
MATVAVPPVVTAEAALKVPLPLTTENVTSVLSAIGAPAKPVTVAVRLTDPDPAIPPVTEGFVVVKVTFNGVAFTFASRLAAGRAVNAVV